MNETSTWKWAWLRKIKKHAKHSQRQHQASHHHHQRTAPTQQIRHPEAVWWCVCQQPKAIVPSFLYRTTEDFFIAQGELAMQHWRRHLTTATQEMTISTSKDDIGGSCGLLTLPPEVLILIGSFLDIKSVLNLSSASAAWRNLLYDEHLLWKALYHRYWLSSNKWKYVPSNALALKSLWLVLCVPFHFKAIQLHFFSFADPISGGGITQRLEERGDV
jgi:hypothetical protein